MTRDVKSAPAVCLCTPRYPPVIDGVGDYTYFLAGALADLGCTVDVVTSSEVGEDPGRYPGHPKVSVHREMRTWGVQGLPALLEVVKALPSDAVCIQYAPHAYDLRGLTLGVNLLPALLRLTTPKRVGVNYHELYIGFDRSLKRSLGSLWQRGTALLMGASSDFVLANCTEWRHRLARLALGKPITVIPVGSNIPRVRVEPEELREIRSRFLGRDDGVLVGCFGSTAPHRDPELLRDALAIVREHCEGTALGIVWLGRSGSRGAGLDETGIQWTGTLPHPQISRIMSACDMFVLPFIDGVSTKRGTLAAALLHELPILATRGQRVDDIFVQAENIYMVPVGDAEALGNAIVSMATSPALRQRLSQGARELHRSHFSWSRIAARVLEVVRN